MPSASAAGRGPSGSSAHSKPPSLPGPLDPLTCG